VRVAVKPLALHTSVNPAARIITLVVHTLSDNERKMELVCLPANANLPPSCLTEFNAMNTYAAKWSKGLVHFGTDENEKSASRPGRFIPKVISTG
jgi:hypothetical protein